MPLKCGARLMARCCPFQSMRKGLAYRPQRSVIAAEREASRREAARRESDSHHRTGRRRRWHLETSAPAPISAAIEVISLDGVTIAKVRLLTALKVLSH